MNPPILPRLPRRKLLAHFRFDLPEYYNIGVHTVDLGAQIYPDRTALLEPGGRRLSYRGCKELSDRLANALSAQGVAPGERVGLYMGQSLECAISHLAVYKLGAIALPLSLLFGQDALEYRLEHSGARFLIAERESWQSQNLPHNDSLTVTYAEDLLQLASKASANFAPKLTRKEDPAILIYTSGTTGKPKGALLPHQVLPGHLPSFFLYSNFPQAPEIYWSPADWAWAGGLLDVLLPALAYGHTVVAYRAKRFDPHYAVDLMARLGVNHAFLFPTALKLLRSQRAFSSKLSLKSIHSGGEPLGEELGQWILESFGVAVNEFYGQTEANLLVGNSNTVDPIRPGSMGLAYPGHQLVLLDEQGNQLPAGHLGELALKTPDPVAFLGYWNNPQATEAKFSGPYLRTGDLAEVDPEGYFWFKARKDDLIKASGYRISPFEVEDALLSQPQVAMAAVVGEADAERGQKVVAYVRLQPGEAATPELARALQEQVKRRLGHYAYPRELYFVDELPLTATGKIQRFKLRKT
ncbi:MAG: AMP-binding protein [Deinococcus sp.]|nr:AMP-binding protein [Deinococcus sp.]MCL5964309.1 AMP-binding protein [Deinococcus sp.]